LPDSLAAAQATAARVLAGRPEHQRQTFALRLDRWHDDLLDGLQAVYPAAQAEALLLGLTRRMAAAYADRPPELARLDEARTLRPDWFQQPTMLGYATYVDRFAGDLRGVRDRLPYLRELGITYLHLMPLLRTRPGDDDGGYAVVDYRAVQPGLGTVQDLRDLATELRSEGISLVLDLVLNHVAREHPWAEAARAGDPHHRGYFHVFPGRDQPDAYERSLPEVFPDTAPGSFTWDDDLAGWVWTTFNPWQWDVRWANPDVFAEYVDVLLHLANLGVEVFRLDAIAFLWKRLGTSCQNQPEVHAITQALRAVARIACPAVALKAEAIVGPDHLLGYLGQGARHGKVSDLAYHNGLMVQIWSMLACGEVRLAVPALRRLSTTPASTAWVTYLRCHDDIGWAVGDDDAAAAGLSGGAHRAFLADWYSGQFPGSWARGLVFQHDPATGDRRISGTAAELAGVSAAAAGPGGVPAAAGPGGVPAAQSTDPDALELAVRRLVLAHTITFGWGGVPVLWMGDELALPNDPAWADQTGHRDDNRWAHRPPMPWAATDLRHDPQTVPGRVFGAVQRLARARAGLPQLHAATDSEVLDPSDPGVLAVLRRHPAGPLLALYNVTSSWRPWPGHRLTEAGLMSGGQPPTDALTGQVVAAGADGNLRLAPYAATWLVRLP
jgi:amylosucrase